MKAITDYGNLMALDVTEGEEVSLRRGAYIASSREMDFETRRDSKGTKSWMRLFAGGNVTRVIWRAKEATRLTASLDFIGTTIGIEVGEETVQVAPKLFLGYRGEVHQSLGRAAKKEFWLMSKLSGEGEVFLHIPGGYSVVEIAGSAFVDTDRVAAVIGDLEAVGVMRGAKDILKSGEMDVVQLEGSGYAVIAHNSLEDVENEAASWLSFIPGLDTFTG